ncbi:uncharacterized protein LOC105387754 [Plutella xylostella]|uniref:uncharacterized protein LOC105387754 n=1 Tax=Plutella xylostella TaxID=51655 RepID=UPI0020325CA8|nr:uncharacterized protein LOC105387754 [Plutella xylostella]
MSHIRMQRHLREKLIEQIQKYPILYNTNHENHRDNDLRDCAWNQIAEVLGVNSDTLKREWKILRDSLRQALKKQKQGGKADKGRKWYFESKMSFLFPFMTKRITYKRVPNSTTLDEVKLDTTDADYDEDQPLATPARGEGAWGRDEGGWAPEPLADPLELFFASVCQSTRRLPRKVQSQVKRQILDVLLKAEEETEDSKAFVSVDTEYVT